jgi:hypothetical protein
MGRCWHSASRPGLARHVHLVCCTTTAHCPQPVQLLLPCRKPGVGLSMVSVVQAPRCAAHVERALALSLGLR